MKKKFLSMLLALSMVVTVLPMTVLASEQKGKIHGANATWGKQTISSGSEVDWSSTKLDTTLGEGTTTVGSYHDARLTNMETSFDVTGGRIVGTYSATDTELSNIVKKKYDSVTALQEAMKNFKDGEDFGTTLGGDISKLIGETVIVDVELSGDGDAGTHDFYFTKLAVTDKGTATLDDTNSEGNMIKGVKLSGLSSALTKDTSGTVTDPHSNAAVATLSYWQATGNGKTVFAVKDQDTTDASYVGAHVIEYSGTGDVENVGDEYAQGEDLDVALSNITGEKDETLWFAVKLLADDGKRETYYVGNVKVSAKGKSDAAVVKGIVEKGSDKKDLVAYGGSGTVTDPYVLSAELSYAKKAGTNEKDLTDIKVTLTLSDTNASAKYAMADSVPVNSKYNGTPSKSGTAVTLKGDMTKNAFYFKITAQDTKTIAYYKVVVTMADPSNDATIHKGNIVGNVSDRNGTTVEIQGLEAGAGTEGAATELTAELPYKTGDLTGYQSNTKLSLVVDKKATVQYAVQEKESVIGTSLSSVSQTDKYVKIEETEKALYAGTINLARGKGGVLIIVTAEDGTQGVYFLKVTEKGAGETARLTKVTATVNGKAVGTAPDLAQDPTNSTTKTPVEITMTVPAGDYSSGVKVEVEAGDNAKIFNYYTNSKFDASAERGNAIGKLNLGTVYIDNPVYIKVLSEKEENGSAVADSYYKLVITEATIEDADPDDSVDVVLEEGKIVVNDGANTVESLKAGIAGAGEVAIFNQDGNDVTDTAEKVGTGYTIVVDNVELDVIVKGDTDGDGATGLSDIINVLDEIDTPDTLTGVYKEAADVDSNGTVGLTDLIATLDLYEASL